MSAPVAQLAQLPRTAARLRWFALIVLCLGVLMIVLDTTIVNVALPSIREDLKLADDSLVWIVNAYMLTFGGSLILGGRLGDLYGRRMLFLAGIVLFTAASVACGLATTQAVLVMGRAIQGLGGAVVVAVALSLITAMFPDPAERAKALGVYGFVCAGGGSIGVLLGGTLTHVLNWHWIFLVNLPIGLAVCALCVCLLPDVRSEMTEKRLDVWGAVTITASLMLWIYAVVNGNEFGWTSGKTLGLLGGAAILLGSFLLIEARVPYPLMPLGIFRLPNLIVSNLISVLWAIGACAWFMMSALYMQLVLGFAPIEVGMAYVPANVITAAFALGMSARLVTRYGVKRPLAVGLALGTTGLALFANAPVDGEMLTHVLPSMILLGLGTGIAFNPLLLAALSDVSPSETGLASGIINTTSLMGGALGLAVLASVSASRTASLLEAGASTTAALAGGYRVAFLIGASCAALGALGVAFLRPVKTPKHSDR